MTTVMTGEALSNCNASIAHMMRLYRVQEAKVNRIGQNTSENEAGILERDFNDIVDAIVSGKNACIHTSDAISALEYIRDEFEGEDFMADAMIRAVINWLRGSTFSKSAA